jgi:calcium-dependent protein kinase
MAVNFIRRLLTKDPEKRSTAFELLSDPWFKNAKNTKVDEATMNQTLANMMQFNAT